MHVEQSFGQINSRFGILWRPLKFRLENIPTIIFSAFLLHNFCIDNMEPPISMEAIQQAKMASEFSDWWSECSASTANQGRRRDLDMARTRKSLTDLIRNLGIKMPTH
jgi:hypothetical protein